MWISYNNVVAGEISFQKTETRKTNKKKVTKTFDRYSNLNHSTYVYNNSLKKSFYIHRFVMDKIFLLFWYSF